MGDRRPTLSFLSTNLGMRRRTGVPSTYETSIAVVGADAANANFVRIVIVGWPICPQLKRMSAFRKSVLTFASAANVHSPPLVTELRERHIGQ